MWASSSPVCWPCRAPHLRSPVPIDPAWSQARAGPLFPPNRNRRCARKSIGSKRDFDARLAALEAKLASAQNSATPVPSPAGAVAGQPTAPIPDGAQGAGGNLVRCRCTGRLRPDSKIFNPDIAVIGDFVGTTGNNEVHPDPGLEMQESEASFQAVVDPFGRADFYLAFGEEGVELEEGYITLTSLPGGLLTKVGKMRAAFGKVNGLHTHVLPWTDRPLVIENLRRRRRWYLRCGHFRGASDSESVAVSRGDRTAVPGRFG